MDFSTRYAQLNTAQKQAVDTTDGPVMVIAGPGTGKTELLSVRAANILKKTDSLPENILCLTFTDSGAAAMRERLVGIIGKDAYKVAIHTFHSFGSEIINQYRDYFFRGALFEPADDLRRYEILQSIFAELPLGSPLASKMNGEFTHFSDAQRVISELKRTSALTSDELLAVIEQSEAAIDTIEHLLMPIMNERVSKKTGVEIAKLLADELTVIYAAAEPLHDVTPLARIIIESLQEMILLTESEHPTKPISAWKKAWLKPDDQKKQHFKTRERLVKLRAVAHVYFQYISRMEQASLYDYDDMIMQVVHAIEVNDDLRYELQEKYLYIMVDEFQDTNVAQMRIIHNLTENPVNEGKPNILVVGDDDQAVYGFQGADISNIIRFKDLYPSLERIVLTDNYRSGSVILDQARQVITQGSDRLERLIPELNKELTAQRKDAGEVRLIEAETIDAERHWLVSDIAEAIKAGETPSEIAVLARNHHELVSLVPYFQRYDIPIRYERQENILESAPLKTLLLLSRVIVALEKSQHDEANALLPELLAHPAWGLTPVELWQLSTTAYAARQPWMTVMSTTPRFTDIHTQIVTWAADATIEPLEPMLDKIIGRPKDDEPASPLYEYFFSEKALAEAPEQYLEHLSALRTIREKMRGYQPDTALTLASFVDFIHLYQQLGTPLLSSRASRASSDSAVQLLTAHKSKGLEFDRVYVINSIDAQWGQTARTKSRTIGYPENLPLSPTGNTLDERLRLYYVAMTRARKHLTLSFSGANSSNKATLLASFLISDSLVSTTLPESTKAVRVEAEELAWYEPLVQPTKELRELLAPQLEAFSLSATALHHFLDIERGGPQHFLMNNLLHFPSTRPAAASYGTAVHRALQNAHVHLLATGDQKPFEDILHDFETALALERLSPHDQTLLLQKGSEQLPIFLAAESSVFTAAQKSEVPFAHQAVHIGDARLTGNIDVLELDKTEQLAVVTDYKTGTPLLQWRGGADYAKKKAYQYRQQLLFYKLLVEGSRDYHNYTVSAGRIAFIEPTARGEVITLETEFTPEEVTHLTQLIEAVWKRIETLDLPDISAYPPTVEGIIAFEQDLIDNTV